MEWAEYKATVKEALEGGQYDKALATLLEALDYVKRTNGTHERLCLCLDQLAWIYVNNKDLDRAADCYKESMEIKSQVLGEKNPIVARACKKLATVVYMQKRYDEAEKYSKMALNIFKSTLGADNEETQQTLADIVSLLRKLNRNIEADILQNMGKAAVPSDKRGAYEEPPPVIHVKICPNCNMAYDGDYCTRCTESRAKAITESQANIQQIEQIQQVQQTIPPHNTTDQNLPIPPSNGPETSPLGFAAGPSSDHHKSMSEMLLSDTDIDKLPDDSG